MYVTVRSVKYNKTQRILILIAKSKVHSTKKSLDNCNWNALFIFTELCPYLIDFLHIKEITW